MGVAFENAAVHERARIALVGVTHHIAEEFSLAVVGVAESLGAPASHLPFLPRGEAGAAPAAQPRLLDPAEHLARIGR